VGEEHEPAGAVRRDEDVVLVAAVVAPMPGETAGAAVLDAPAETPREILRRFTARLADALCAALELHLRGEHHVRARRLEALAFRHGDDERRVVGDRREEARGGIRAGRQWTGRKR